MINAHSNDKQHASLEFRSSSRHSMGGHGALISFLKRPNQYKSVSALAPICNVSKCEWGIDAYTKFFGPGSFDVLSQLPPASNFFVIADEKLWKEYDATELIASYQGRKPHGPVLIDQGSDDQFKDKYLCPDKLVVACKNASFPIDLRMQEGYDHSYFFIMTFLEDHFKYHKKELEH